MCMTFWKKNRVIWGGKVKTHVHTFHGMESHGETWSRMHMPTSCTSTPHEPSVCKSLSVYTLTPKTHCPSTTLSINYPHKLLSHCQCHCLVRRILRLYAEEVMGDCGVSSEHLSSGHRLTHGSKCEPLYSNTEQGVCSTCRIMSMTSSTECSVNAVSVAFFGLRGCVSSSTPVAALRKHQHESGEDPPDVPSPRQ